MKVANGKGLLAGEWVAHVAPILGGKGGGKAESAQASGPNHGEVAKAIESAKAFAAAKLGTSTVGGIFFFGLFLLEKVCLCHS